MKHLLLVLSLALTSMAYGQAVYTNTKAGSYSDPNTWGGAASAPPVSGTCNCQIVIKTNTTVTFTGDMTLTNANFVLPSSGSELNFQNNVHITLEGSNSSFDVQVSGARISRTTGNVSGISNSITLGGQVIFDQNTKVNALLAGRVNGPASAAAIRSSPQFQQDVTLPVKLTDFQVAEKKGAVMISWKTASEINAGAYLVERSADSKNWSSIGSIKASGNTTSDDKDYAFTDNAPMNGDNYYRLKITDKDGSFEYSPIKAIKVAAGFNIAIGPNPVSGMLNVKFNQSVPGNYQIKLINRIGQVLYNKKYAASNTLSIPVTAFAEGNYLLEVTNDVGAKTTKNIMILKNR